MGTGWYSSRGLPVQRQSSPGRPTGENRRTRKQENRRKEEQKNRRIGEQGHRRTRQSWPPSATIVFSRPLNRRKQENRRKGRQFEETFEDAQWKKVKPMQPMGLL